MSREQVERLVRAYNKCLEKEENIEAFFKMETDCNFLQEVSSEIFEAIISGVPEEFHYQISKHIFAGEVDEIYRIINGEARK